MIEVMIVQYTYSNLNLKIPKEIQIRFYNFGRPYTLSIYGLLWISVIKEGLFEFGALYYEKIMASNIHNVPSRSATLTCYILKIERSPNGPNIET